MENSEQKSLSKSMGKTKNDSKTTKDKKQILGKIPGIESIPEILMRFSKDGILSPEEEKLLGIPAPLSGKSFSQLSEIRKQSQKSKSSSVGVELFNSPGHQLVAGNITMTNADGTTFSSSSPVFTIGSTAVAYADIVALAGDFFAGSSIANIQNTISQSAPADQFSVFTDKYESLVNQNVGLGGSSTPVADLLVDFAEQTNIVLTAKSKYGPNSSWLGYKEPTEIVLPSILPDFTLSMENYFDYLVFIDAVGVYYWLIASYNFDHFGDDAITAYTVGHAAACNFAATAQSAVNPALNLMTAYMINAYADHYMTDLFAPGHLRVPRVELHNLAPYYGDRLAQLMHGEDNIMGLNLTNSQGTQWVGYGDTRAFDDINAVNISYGKQAVTASINEVYNAFVTENPVPANLAIQIAPDPATVMADTTNHAAMFIWNGTEILSRTPISAPVNIFGYQPVTNDSAGELYDLWSAATPDYYLSWGNQSTIRGSSCKDGGLSMTTWNDTLYAVWLDHNQDDEKFQLASSTDGVNWTILPNPLDSSGGASNENPPALVVFNNQLYLAWNGYGNDGIWFTSTSDGMNWSPQSNVPGSGPTKYGAPSLAVFNDCLYFAWCQHTSSPGADTKILMTYIDQYVNWSSPVFVEGPGTDDNGPTLGVLNNLLIISWFGYDYEGVWWSAFDGTNWQYNNQNIPGTSTMDCKYGGPRLTNFDGELYNFWLESDDNPTYSVLAISEGDSDGNGDNEIIYNWAPTTAISNLNVDELPLAACQFGEYLALGWIDDKSNSVMVQLGTPTVWTN